ncbi:hypothetical protein ACIHFE_13940 [Streptomyces sp. NPDC052396]|uniref:hypothetical protein n=1 Tax=Streptomyces sp. NPDC052396 TaxID=3365689 RepID=UPI0037D729DB
MPGPRGGRSYDAIRLPEGPWRDREPLTRDADRPHPAAGHGRPRHPGRELVLAGPLLTHGPLPAERADPAHGTVERPPAPPAAPCPAPTN